MPVLSGLLSFLFALSLCAGHTPTHQVSSRKILLVVYCLSSFNLASESDLNAGDTLWKDLGPHLPDVKLMVMVGAHGSLELQVKRMLWGTHPGCSDQVNSNITSNVY